MYGSPPRIVDIPMQLYYYACGMQLQTIIVAAVSLTES